MKLVDNWRDAWTWYSEWAFAGITTVAGVTVYLTPEMLGAPILFFPSWTWAKAAASIVAFLAVTGGITRLIPQPPKTTNPTAVDVEVP